MKIINNTPKKPTVSVFMLNSGEVYRMANGSTDILMVIEKREELTPAGYKSRVIRSSVSLTTGKVIPWNGHEKEHCVVLKATLEVSE